jgi:integration host factor subunit alpha
LVEQPFKKITDCLEYGEMVKLSSFGSSLCGTRDRGWGAIPKRGRPAGLLVFKPSDALRKRRAGGERAID